jgi:glycosyltransferase involved in cell wall biosynthesis
MKLTIVIPAYNEEDAIASIIERCLAARETIIEASPVDDVEVIVVSDGSTDRTVELASRYDEARLIVFERNRGYGAAIKKGFEEGTGQLVGFLDADGTCDPTFFATLCRALVEETAHVAIGSRMGPQSRMPAVRRLGNRIYALILSALSNTGVTDTASGMRVIRRDALPQLYPLPDGLHFTPAMSARVLMDDRLTIVERPMRYEERIGDSKLHVVRDGARFLHTIFEMTLMWRPAKLFVLSAVVCLGLMTLLAMHPIETWLRAGGLRADTVYRLLFCSFLGTLGVTLLSAGLICSHLHRLLDEKQRPRTFLWMLLDAAYSLRGVVVATCAAAPLLVWLIGEGVMTRLLDGYVNLHWSRVVLAGLVAFSLCQMLVTVLIINLLRFHTARKPLLVAQQTAARAATLPTITPTHEEAVRTAASMRSR